MVQATQNGGGGGGLSLKCGDLNPSANYVIWERNVITKFTRSSSIKKFWTKSVVSILKRNNFAKKCVNGNPWRTLKNKIVKIRWLNFFILCIFPRFIGAMLLSIWHQKLVLGLEFNKYNIEQNRRTCWKVLFKIILQPSLLQTTFCLSLKKQIQILKFLRIKFKKKCRDMLSEQLQQFC